MRQGNEYHALDPYQLLRCNIPWKVIGCGIRTDVYKVRSDGKALR
jgi:hypothetical protein